MSRNLTESLMVEGFKTLREFVGPGLVLGPVTAINAMAPARIAGGVMAAADKVRKMRAAQGMMKGQTAKRILGPNLGTNRADMSRFMQPRRPTR